MAGGVLAEGCTFFFLSGSVTSLKDGGGEPEVSLAESRLHLREDNHRTALIAHRSLLFAKS
jgi:hypothetical protein